MAERPEMPGEDDVRERFTKIREELHNADLPDLPDEDFERLHESLAKPVVKDDDLQAKLDHLQGRIRKVKGTYETAFNKEPKKLKQSQKEAHGLGVGILVAYIIIGMPLAGVLVGWILDRVFRTTILIGLGCLAGATAGVVIAVVMINKIGRDG